MSDHYFNLVYLMKSKGKTVRRKGSQYYPLSIFHECCSHMYLVPLLKENLNQQPGSLDRPLLSQCRQEREMRPRLEKQPCMEGKGRIKEIQQNFIYKIKYDKKVSVYFQGQKNYFILSRSNSRVSTAKLYRKVFSYMGKSKAKPGL